MVMISFTQTPRERYTGYRNYIGVYEYRCRVPIFLSELIASARICRGSVAVFASCCPMLLGFETVVMVRQSPGQLPPSWSGSHY